MMPQQDRCPASRHPPGAGLELRINLSTRYRVAKPPILIQINVGYATVANHDLRKIMTKGFRSMTKHTVSQAEFTHPSESVPKEKRRWWLNLFVSPRTSRCVYCGISAFGPGCSDGPRGVHQHKIDEKHCEYCGSTAYGPSCSYSPTGLHCHGGGSHCRWCGSKAGGFGCRYYPTGMHE